MPGPDTRQLGLPRLAVGVGAVGGLMDRVTTLVLGVRLLCAADGDGRVCAACVPSPTLQRFIGRRGSRRLGTACGAARIPAQRRGFDRTESG